MRLFRMLMRVFTSVPCIGIVGLLIMFPLVLGIVAAQRDLRAGKDVEHIAEMLEGLGIILIGWGVAIEERHSLRQMAGLIGSPDSEREIAIDHVSHSNGICMLILGLFAEIGVEAVRLPNDVLPTFDFDEGVTWITIGFVVVGGLVLLHHLAMLAGIVWFGHRPKMYHAN
ncbi:MAG: hypothetical protein ACHQPH_21565 [Reyranellales bacterium]